LSALGLGTAGATAAAAASTAGAAGATTATATVLKVTIVAGLMAGAFGAGVVVERQRLAAEIVPPRPVVLPVPVEPPPTPAPVLVVEAPPPAPVAMPPAVRAPPPPRAVEAPEDALSLELESLDRARTFLGAGDAAKALAEITGYQKRFPSGTLATEATLVQLEALLKLGRRAEAEVVSRRFVARNPSELVRQRVQRIFDAN
ncbi:MAG: hypothetical protein JNG84_12480, partial [Archangium sp.]|nr:hypothetical protein [Archangium sp.]